MLLHRIISTTLNNCLTLYAGLNQCQNSIRTDSLGHPVNCSLDCNCSSLLRPARLLSSHFPVLGNILNRVYQIWRVSHAIRAVERALASGCYDQLKGALQNLMKVMRTPTDTDTGETGTADTEQVQDDSSQACQVSEDEVMTKFGKGLRQVNDIRNTYNIKACDLCEQLKTKLSTLRSYENKNGFDR